MPTKLYYRYAQIVEQVEHLVRSGLSDPICVATISERLSISERRLRSAFRVVHGKSPYRYLRSVRFAEARRVLLSIDPASASVTTIATDHGFVELGRFSVEYRMAFGESPSATLNRTRSFD